MMDFQAARYLNDGDVPVQCGNDHPTASPMGLFQAQDGSVNIGVAGDGNWGRFCDAVGAPQWRSDERFASNKLRIANRAALTAEIDAVFSTRPMAHWVDVLNAAGVPAGPVYDVAQMFEDPQVRHMQACSDRATPSGLRRSFLTQPVQLSRTPASVASTAPDCGEHTDEVLAEAGFSAEEIAQLHATRTV